MLPMPHKCSLHQTNYLDLVPLGFRRAGTEFGERRHTHRAFVDGHASPGGRLTEAITGQSGEHSLNVSHTRTGSRPRGTHKLAFDCLQLQCNAMQCKQRTTTTNRSHAWANSTTTTVRRGQSRAEQSKAKVSFYWLWETGLLVKQSTTNRSHAWANGTTITREKNVQMLNKINAQVLSSVSACTHSIPKRVYLRTSYACMHV